MLISPTVRRNSVLATAVIAVLISARCASNQATANAPIVADQQAATKSERIWNSGDAIREVAATQDDQDQMEEKFQSIMASANPETEMIDYADQLFTLLIQANVGIEQFSHELDIKLAKHRKSPKEKIEEPLQSKTYAKLLKMWQLRDRYEGEITYDYLRLMQTRTDHDSSTALKDRARNVQIATEKHLKATQNLKRVELQDLMQSLVDVYRSFTKDYIARTRAARVLEQPTDAATQVASPTPMTDTPPSALESAIMDSKAIQKYITSNPNQKADTPADTIEKARHEKFMKKIDADIAAIPDAVMESEREPQSTANAGAPAAAAGDERGTPSRQISSTSGWGSVVYPNTGDPGNLVGKNLPAGVWAFTFDDGPAVKSTGDLLDYLNSYHDSVNPHAKATFFWMARNVPSFPNWVQKAYNSGYPFENHSWTHANFAKSSSAVRRHEVVDANTLLTKEYRKVDPNYVIKFYRCPYGACYAPKIPEVRQLIADLGLVHVYWRIDSLDWKLKNGPRTAALVEKQMQLLDHGIILMHDIHPPTVDAVKIILPWMKDQNDKRGAHYKMVTIPEAADMLNGKTH